MKSQGLNGSGQGAGPSAFNNSLFFFSFVDLFCFSEAEAAGTSPVAEGQAPGYRADWTCGLGHGIRRQV